ncbi:MAG: porin [Lentisphaerae bacterium]|nr:porin [Lentisphaerota bacterium]
MTTTSRTGITLITTILAATAIAVTAQEENNVQLGGYGELHGNKLVEHGSDTGKHEVDFHRFVIYFGYDFSDRIRFSSEVELEHALAGSDAPGEVELEQAFLDFDLHDAHTVRAGLFLLPVGLLNPTHEPTRFYGVERNPVESRIIPTTWWEAGVGLHGGFGDALNYSAYVHSGLDTSSNSSYAVRSGRQKVAQADASSPAGTLALNWLVPGITVGGAVVYQSDMTQGSDVTAGSGLLGELHAEIRRGPLALRALYAEWGLAGDGPRSLGADRQYGWYVEPAYQPIDQVGIFARYGEWNNQAGDADAKSRKTQVDLGVNWWPHEQVVVKADYQWQNNDDGKDRNGFNLGIGYDF